MAQSIFISGATGNIGSPLVDALRKMGASVRAGAHSQKSRQALAAKGVEVVDFDFQDKQSIVKALKGCKKAFSLSPIAPNMAEQGLNFIEAAKESGVEYVLRSSGMGADNPQAISLGRQHRKVELALESSGLAYSIIRPNSFMQNYINFTGETIRAGNAIYLPMGNGRISLIDARDVADAAAEILTNNTHAGKAYTLTGSEAISNQEIADLLTKATGRQIAYVDIPEQKAREAMLNIGMPEIITEWILELYAINKAGYTAALSTSFKDILGREARTFETFAHEYASSFK